MNSEPALCLLLCHRDVDMALACLDSIRRLCTPKIRFRIHDDGSLIGEDHDRLSLQGDVEIVTRQEADERMESMLRSFPACRKLRRDLPLALKLFDTILLSPTDNFSYIDSDMLFLSRFRNPFCADTYASKSVFMRDRENSYSIRSWTYAFTPRIRLPSRLNAGLIVFHRSLFDLELIEWFLSNPATNAIPSMREQTTWAILGKRAECEMFDESQVRVMREKEPDEEQLLAGHFTARTRFLLPQYVERSLQADPNASPATFRTKPCGTCSATQIVWYEIRRSWQKVVGAACIPCF
jgi:hypothetical protein